MSPVWDFIMGARSSWSGRQPVTLEIAGSSPVVPAKCLSNGLQALVVKQLALNQQNRVRPPGIPPLVNGPVMTQFHGSSVGRAAPC